VDPWECYQDTWQTTCSVLEHHRDLMKVSASAPHVLILYQNQAADTILCLDGLWSPEVDMKA